MQGKLHHLELEFSTLTVEYYRLTSERPQHPSKSDYETAIKTDETLISAVGSSFKGINMVMAMIMALLLDSMVVAADHLVLSKHSCGYTHYLF